MIRIVVPLGLIIDTDVIRACESFARLFADLKLDLNIYGLLRTPEVQKLFLEFNTGAHSEEDFGRKLLDLIAAAVPKTATPVEGWRIGLRALWKDCWNEQCKVNDESVAVLAEILETESEEVVVEIFSETNPAHLELIAALLAKRGIDITQLQLHTSIDSKNSVDVMLQEYAAEHKQDKIVRLKGSTERMMQRALPSVTDKAQANGILATFKGMADQKEKRISDALKQTGGLIQDITIFPTATMPADAPLQLTAARFRSIVADHQQVIKSPIRRNTPATPIPLDV